MNAPLRHFCMAVVVVVGCSKPPNGTRPTASRSEPPVQPVDGRSALPATNDLSAASAMPHVTAVVDGDTASLSKQSASAPPAETTPAEPAAEPDRQATDYRLLLPTSAGLLIVDAQIMINDVPLQQAYDAAIADTLAASRGENDTTTWPSLFQYVADNPMKFPGITPIRRGQHRDLIKRFDRNRNHRPEPNEAARILFQASPHWSSFRLLGTDSFRSINRMNSQLFAVVDRNDDQQLDRDEIKRAGEALRKLDRNADDRIDLAELDDPVTPTEAWKRTRSKRWGEVAMDLEGEIDWSMISYMLGGLDQPGPWGQSITVSERLDENGDASLSQPELRRLQSIPADLRIVIVFGSDPGSDRIRWDSISPRIASRVTTREAQRKISLRDKSISLTLMMMPSTVGMNPLTSQDFAQLDVNNDGGLDQNELPASARQQFSSADFDIDGNGKLTKEELRSGMARQLPIWSVQVRARGAEASDAVFFWLDQNHDSILSAREIDTATQSLDLLRSHRSVVVPSDVPDAYVVQFGRGIPSQDAQLFAIQADRSAPDDRYPRWVQALDANRDGDISRQEFVGTMNQFNRLDTNHDGYIDYGEADANRLRGGDSAP